MKHSKTPYSTFLNTNYGWLLSFLLKHVTMLGSAKITKKHSGDNRIYLSPTL